MRFLGLEWIRKRTLAVEEARRVFAGESEGLWEFADQFDYLGDMVFVLAVSRPGGRIEEVIPASEEFKQLGAVSMESREVRARRAVPHKRHSKYRHLDPIGRPARPLGTDTAWFGCHR